MKHDLPLPQEKKLTVLFRIEPGSLGPDGDKHMDDFCAFAQKELDGLDADYMHWEIIPRHDKSLPEMEYRINNRRLPHDKAAKYLEIFGQDLDGFELDLARSLSSLIGRFLGH
ncbi:MAG: hypothetical protein P8Z39_03340 [Gammaproteobacteria bacterium]